MDIYKPKNKNIFIYINNIDYIIASISLFLMTIVALLAIFYRFILNDPLIWSDEFIKLLFAWFCFTSMSVIAKLSRHLRVDIIDNIVGNKPKIILRMFGNIFVLGTAILLLFYGIALCVSQFDNQFASIPISRVWSFASLPFGSILMSIQLIKLILEDYKNI